MGNIIGLSICNTEDMCQVRDINDKEGQISSSKRIKEKKFNRNPLNYSMVDEYNPHYVDNYALNNKYELFPEKERF